MNETNQLLPEWFLASVYEDGDTVPNPKNGDSVLLSAKELSMYDFIQGKPVTSNFTYMLRGAVWLCESNPEAHKVLFPDCHLLMQLSEQHLILLEELLLLTNIHSLKVINRRMPQVLELMNFRADDTDFNPIEYFVEKYCFEYKIKEGNLPKREQKNVAIQRVIGLNNLKFFIQWNGNESEKLLMDISLKGAQKYYESLEENQGVLIESWEETGIHNFRLPMVFRDKEQIEKTIKNFKIDI